MRMQIRFRGPTPEEIRRKLELLPQEVTGAALREAALEGAEVIREQAVRNAEAIKDTGTLAEDIHVAIDERKTTNTKATAIVGPGDKGWYGRLVEYGHDIVVGGRKRGRKRGRVVGRVQPKPWLRPAGDTKRAEAEQVAMQALLRRLQKVWRRK